jgi:thiol-disulfide isomerase/thioredoxin
MMALLVAAAAVLVSLQARRPEPPNEWAGRPLPPLEAAGWLNTQRPLSADNLRGHVVLIDFWATWCQPCRFHLPELAEFHQRYKDRGVTVIGLTAEPADDQERVKRFVEREGIGWPIAYDAVAAFQAMDIYGMPTYVLFDRAGRSVWGGHSLQGLEEATIAALAKSD